MTLTAFDETELLDHGLRQLRDMLGKDWEVTVTPGSAFQDVDIDAVWGLRRLEDRAYGEIFIEAKTNLSPIGAVHLIAGRLDSLRDRSGRTVLVVSPWLSPRTRRVLEDRGVGYLDLTGNMSVRLGRPAVFIKTEGADQNPSPQPRGRRGLSGNRAARLVRELVDFCEPRRARELALATDLNEGYVSRLLDSLSDEALIQRGKNRLITRIDWQGILQARAGSYQLLKANYVVPALVPQGYGRLLEDLREGLTRHRVLATGSFAAQAFAPTAVGAALMLYIPPGPQVVAEVAKDLGLLRIDQSADADVLLLQSRNEGPMVRPHPERIDGIECVGLSQLVLDCLNGPGRMPADGEAVLTWMSEHESIWRRPSPLEATDGGLR